MHVITGLEQGGSESQLATLLSADAPGMGLPVVVSLQTGGAYRTVLESAGVTVHDLGATTGVSIPLALLRLALLIRRYRPNILHAWMYHAFLFSTVALGLSGCRRATRLVWGVRCSRLDFTGYDRHLRWLVRACGWLSRLPAVVSFNSEAGLVAHRELGFRPRRHVLIDNGIDTERFHPSPSLRSQVRGELGIAPTASLVVHVARVHPVKDHATLLAAVAELDGVEALLIGPGTERLDTQPNAHALGPRRDVERLLPAADLIVSSSLSEGFPNVLAEGMAAGLPAVATDAGDSARIVGTAGRVVPPRDPAALAGAIRSLFGESRAARAALGAEARRRIVNHFSVANATDAHGALYASLDRRRTAAPPRRKWAGAGTWKIALGAVAAALCMAIAFRTIDFDALVGALAGTNPHYATLAVALLLLNSLLAMVRFRVVMRKLGYSPGWSRTFAAFSIGSLGNQFVFNIIGQSVGRAGILTSSGIPFGATIFATFLERILAAGILAAAGLVSVWILLPHFDFEFTQGGSYFLSLAGGLAVVSTSAAMVSYRRGAAARILAATGHGIGRFWPLFLLTVLAHAFMLGAYIAVLLALGLDTPTLEVAGATLIVIFAAALPISLNGWGVRELSAVMVLGAVGIDAPVAFAAALLVGLLSLGVTSIISLPGLWWVLFRGRGSHADTRNVHQPSSPKSNWNAWLIMACGTMIAVTIFFQVRIQNEDSVITANIADGFALVGLGCLILLVMERRKRLAGLPTAFVGVLLAFSLLLVYALVLGYANFGANTWALVNRGLGWVIMLGYAAVGLSIGLLDNERNRHVVLRLFVTAGAAIAVLQLILLVALILGFPPPREAFPYPLRGYTNNANAFGFQMTVTAIAAMVADRIGLLGTGRRWLTAILILIGVAVYFAGSRTAIGMFALVLVLSVLFASPAERRTEIGVSVSVAYAVVLISISLVLLPHLINAFVNIVGIIYGAVLGIINVLLGFLGVEFDTALDTKKIEGMKQVWTRTSVFHASSDHERWRTIVEGWRLWLEHPIIGQGLGAYVQSQLAVSETFLVFHSVPIWLMAEMGLIGLAVGLASFACLYLSAHRMRHEPDLRAWGVGVLMVLLCWGAANQLHDFFVQRAFWFFLGLAFAVSPAAIRARRRSRDDRRSGAGSSGTGAMARRLMLAVTDDRYLWSHRSGLAVAARDAGYEVTVATRVGEYGDRIRALGIELVDVDFGRGRISPWVNLRAVRSLVDIYRRREPDLVHHVAIKPTVLGSVAAAWARVPAVVNAVAGLGTALTSDHPKARLVRPLLRAALGWSGRRARSHTLVQNPENAKFVESLGVPAERISLVRGAGVDTRRFRPEPGAGPEPGSGPGAEPDGPVRVTMVSRLLWDKGVREFVEAAALVRRARTDVTFTLVGAPDEGNPTSVPLETVRSWVAEGLLEWWGRRDDVAEVLARSHVAVLPSYEEGLPMSLLEAAACGRPIVATDVPGCREVVRHGVNGLLVPARDARALADAILELAGDPARRAAMGAEGRRRAETEFAAERIHAETLRVYERALAAAGR